MPRQANGTYIQPANTAAVTLTSISSVAFNTLETDIGTEITNSVDRLGRSAMLAALPMGGQKITGMATPTVATDAVTKAYADSLGPPAFTVVGTGTADVITGVFTPTITSLTNGLTVEVRATAANATTTPTFQADATAAKTIVKGAGVPLIVGNIAGAGFWMSLTYDSVLDKWVLNNPVNLQPASPVPGSFKNLVIKVGSNVTIAVLADFVVTTDGTNYQTTALSQTVNMSTTGANSLDTGAVAAATWYAIWAIAKPDGTTGGLASLSATSPTMPSGYTYKARIGWVRTAPAIAQLMGTWQFGRQVRYVVGLAQTAALPQITSGTTVGNPATPVWVAVATGNFVPSTASMINFFIRNTNTGGTTIVAPNNSYGSVSSANPPPVSLQAVAGQSNSATYVNFMLESTNYYWATSVTTVEHWAMGWEDAL